ncbi:hypothetical protein PAXINDRAFT_17990 [Paxillus involutus ATCC 200175]|uniref:Unplaced genomic scaffold PAXINscaffold_214, whole genome shotgun sequence n=1 Tax=Paxillus involutus ATCC 200175 TaxID=664439 RepID=A0A0C9SPE3_PAXIN|nr:hypothetical protein PAXINDRAFT_17990 [Paxillus involutus ATCC 200175]
MHRCNFCLRTFPTSKAVSLHISGNPTCKQCMQSAQEEPMQIPAQEDPQQPDVPGPAFLEREDQYGGDDQGNDANFTYGLPFNAEVERGGDEMGGANRQPRVEEVEDEYDIWQRFVHSYPGQIASTLGQAETLFETIRRSQEDEGLDPWGPFADGEEWELVKWLIRHVGQSGIEEFTKLPTTRKLQPSFTSNYTLMKAIDKLPQSSEWKLKGVTIEGDLLGTDGQRQTEDVELWMRDPIDCIRELMANPTFRDAMCFEPQRVFDDKQGTMRRYDKMWTADWWWEMQGRLPAGAAVAPIILASDKTSLSQFRGDQEVWPVYLTVGNISKDVRHQPSKHACVLLGYLPTTKLECFSSSCHSVECYRLFHYCMRQILEPLVEAGNTGIPMTCPDGYIRQLHPILAAYVADFPEQCLVACCKESRCPKCVIPRQNCGDLVTSQSRTPNHTLENLGKYQEGTMEQKEFDNKGLRAVYKPFWATLPHSDIFQCITPDILHQLHKGVFKDHIVAWCTEIVGEEELDARFKAMTSYSGLRHFKKGISK